MVSFPEGFFAKRLTDPYWYFTSSRESHEIANMSYRVWRLAKDPEKKKTLETWKENKALRLIFGNDLSIIERVGKNHFRIKNSNLKNGLPAKAIPNSIFDKLDEMGEVLQRRKYDDAGEMKVDFDTSDHGLPKKHPTGAHKHIIDKTRKNPHGKPLPLTEEELEENKDIIQRGVNYHDGK